MAVERVLVVVVVADGGNVSKEERKCKCGWIDHLHECNERRSRRE